MNLTAHFTLAELTASNRARQLKLDNTPTSEALENLRYTAEMLERIRAALGVPIMVTSGYRSPALNRAVGGVTSSDHLSGEAADIVAPRFGTALEVARHLSSRLPELAIGQLIYESFGNSKWVHVSTRTPQRPINRILTISATGARQGVFA